MIWPFHENQKCVWLENTSEKRCIMLSAESLYIKWINDTHCWDWITSPGSRYCISMMI